MEFFKKETRIDFMGLRRYTVTVLLILWLGSLYMLFTKGLNFGLDFTGGTQIEARFENPVDTSEIRKQLEKAGLHQVKVQHYGSTRDLLIRVANVKGANEDQDGQIGGQVGRQDSADKQVGSADKSDQEQEKKISAEVKQLLQKENPGIEIRKTEFVGSEVGEQLFEQGGIAVLVSILATMIYIAFRFEYRLAVSAAVGLIHDGILILGIFSLFGFEFDLATLASVLAVLGYSLNDTIVVFDRVRENFRKVRKGTPTEIMNMSINQTLSRTLMTSWLTLLVVLALLFFGGESLFGFSMAFFLGIVIGTVSSIYVSGALALWLGLTRADLMLKPKVELEEKP